MDGCFRLITVVALAALWAGCDHSVPNFELVDMNAGSESYLELVSPGDFEGTVSAWYFGDAG